MLTQKGHYVGAAGAFLLACFSIFGALFVLLGLAYGPLLWGLVASAAYIILIVQGSERLAPVGYSIWRQSGWMTTLIGLSLAIGQGFELRSLGHVKIGILGNMNNNSNNLMQYPRAAGADAHLLFYEMKWGILCRTRSEIAPDYPHKTLAWGSYRTLMNPAIGPQVRADVAPFDILIGTCLAPAYMSRFVGRPLDVFMPTGGDIWTVPHFSGYSTKNLLK